MYTVTRQAQQVASERGNAVYRIAVLAEGDEKRSAYVDQIARFCHEKGLFPQVEACAHQEQFFEHVQKAAPTNAVIALPGVAGLNAVEHLPCAPDAALSGAAIWTFRCRRFGCGWNISSWNP